MPSSNAAAGSGGAYRPIRAIETSLSTPPVEDAPVVVVVVAWGPVDVVPAPVDDVSVPVDVELVTPEVELDTAPVAATVVELGPEVSPPLLESAGAPSPDALVLSLHPGRAHVKRDTRATSPMRSGMVVPP
jgi:hypothetical protein